MTSRIRIVFHGNGRFGHVCAISDKKGEVAELCRRYGVARLEVFGSAARGTDFGPRSSDADFLAEFKLDDDRAGADIQRFIDGMDGETYVGDARTQATVERKFEIIGEALNCLNQTHPEIADRIPPLREVVGLRDLLIDGYATVIPERVWDYAQNNLPELRRMVQALFAELEPSAA